MALTLKEIQARLLEQEAKKNRNKDGGGYTGGDNAVYPFWDNPTGSTAIIRFLPDGDETNDFFWLERLIIKLPFPGVKGSTDSKPVTVQVPCNDMWAPGSCPITNEIRPWWKDAALEAMARKYYRKKSYLFQGFVTENPHPKDTTPTNPIRRFIINPSIYDSIKTILMDRDLEHSPTDFTNGRDYYLTKTTQGKYSAYTTSKWAMKERALSEDEASAIATHGLWNLRSFLPKKPDDQHLAVIMELFKASVDEELYDPDRWGQFYKPYGVKVEGDDTEGSATKTVVPVSKPATEQATTASAILNKLSTSTSAPSERVVETQVSSGTKPQTPEEIIAAIRARQAKK